MPTLVSRPSLSPLLQGKKTARTFVQAVSFYRPNIVYIQFNIFELLMYLLSG